jgi:membrane associated rhomboid family serine protease
MSNYSFRPYNLLPEVVKNLLIINVIVFIGQQLFFAKFGFELAEKFGLHFMLADSFRPFQFITYMFLHGSFTHLLFNMLALYMFGTSIENYWGSKRFLIYYIVCGIGAALVHYAIFYFTFDMDTQLLDMPVIIGASGAVFGLLLAYGMMFPNQVIYVQFIIPMKAKYFVALYGAIELFSGFNNSPSDNVAHFAHLGGMLFGFILIRYWKNNPPAF